MIREQEQVVVFRPAQKSDKNAINAMPRLPYLSGPRFMDWCAHEYIVLEVDGEVYGYAWTRYERIRMFAIRADKQRQGWGRKLLTEAIATIQQQGHQHACLWVYTDNVAAVELYRSLGFSKRKDGDHGWGTCGRYMEMILRFKKRERTKRA